LSQHVKSIGTPTAAKPRIALPTKRLGASLAGSSRFALHQDNREHGGIASCRSSRPGRLLDNGIIAYTNHEAVGAGFVELHSQPLIGSYS
jgi:hypothetical protein